MSLNDHLSRPAVTDRFERPTRKHSGQLYRSRFGLASDGVYMCPCCYQQGGSLLHCLSTLTSASGSGLFLLHWPWSHLHRTLSGILPYEARTFLVCGLSAMQPRSFVLLTLLSIFILHSTPGNNFPLQILSQSNCLADARCSRRGNTPRISEDVLPHDIPVLPALC